MHKLCKQTQAKIKWTIWHSWLSITPLCKVPNLFFRVPKAHSLGIQASVAAFSQWTKERFATCSDLNVIFSKLFKRGIVQPLMKYGWNFISDSFRSVISEPSKVSGTIFFFNDDMLNVFESPRTPGLPISTYVTCPSAKHTVNRTIQALSLYHRYFGQAIQRLRVPSTAPRH